MKLINKFSLSIATVLSALAATAQTTATPPASKLIAFDVNTVLAITVAVLLLVIILMAFMLKSSIDLYRDDHLQARRAAKANKTGTLVILFLLAGMGTVYAQATGDAATAETVAAPPLTAYQFNSTMITTILIIAMAIEVFVIFYLLKWIKFFTGIQAFEERRRVAAGEDPDLVKKGGFKAWWAKINKFRSMREESDLETGHEYDGIKELDNATPPWFTWSFLATIVFGIIYIWYYNTTGLSQEEEYARAVEIADRKMQAVMASQANSVDENTVTMLDAAGIAAGKTIFTANCAACHSANGGGGIGPNLTDAFTLHGGTIKEVFHTVKYGVIDKGMQAWSSMLSPTQIAEVSSFIVSIQGTNVAGGKEPQGNPFNPTEAQNPVTSPDSSGVPDAAVIDTAKVARLK